MLQHYFSADVLRAIVCIFTPSQYDSVQSLLGGQKVSHYRVSNYH